MSSTQFGLLSTGFKPMRQADCIADLQAALQASFGSQVNLADSSVFGQIVGIMSERFALLWALGEAIYANGTIQGATGVSIDNLLAQVNLTRLAATATKTNPNPVANADGTTTYGLTLLGTAGLTVPAGTLISNGQSPPVTFALDADVYIDPGSTPYGTGTATCTQTGPFYVAAGTLTTIASPLTGFSAVTNGLDCLQGQNAETDSAALYRMSKLRSSQGSTSTEAIVQRVALVSGVTQVRGFANTTNAAQQLLTFSATPTVGSYQLALADVTSPILIYSATAAQVQAAINSLPGYASVLVSGSVTYGFVVDFNGSFGGQAQQKIQAVNNSTGVTLTATFGRPPHSIEIIAEGGANTDIANAIVASSPAGVASWGTPVLTTTGSVTAGSATMTVATSAGLSVGLGVTAYGVVPGTQITSINQQQLTLSATAIGTYTNEACRFDHTTQVLDAGGNAQLVGFSRPAEIPIFVQIQLTTDTFNSPGNPLSGNNIAAQWSASSVAAIQADILSIGNAIDIGGLVTANGTNGLAASFTKIDGVVDSTLSFGVTPNPTQNAPIRLLPNQVALFELANVAVIFE